MDIITDNIDFVDMFEAQLCKYTGFKHAVCVDCCTNGLLLSLERLWLDGTISKADPVAIPKRTYLSVPMTLVLHGWPIAFADVEWEESYELGNTGVFDAAVHFEEGMRTKYLDPAAVVVSF